MEVFRARLVNDQLGDPALFVGLHWERRALLFDLGPVESLPVRELLKVTDAFVSHTHIDHFIGFDHLLRVALGQRRLLRLYGPPGFLGNVQGKLAGYTWNLAEDYPLVIEAWELDARTPSVPAKTSRQGPEAQGLEGVSGELRGARFPCARRFHREDLPSRPFYGLLYEDDHFQVECSPLDHGGIPSLGFALQEKKRLNIDPARLEELGLSPGPWLAELKRALRQALPPETPMRIAGQGPEGRQERIFTVAELASELVRISSGMRITYVADARYTEQNQQAIVRLAGEADVFYCDAAFLEADDQAPKDWFHLTARQAGLLARRAKARRLVPFHFSPRYRDRPEALEQEAAGAFQGWEV